MTSAAVGGQEFVARLLFGPMVARMGADASSSLPGAGAAADRIAELADVGSSLRTIVVEAMGLPHLEESSPFLRQALRGADDISLVPREQSFEPAADFGAGRLRDAFHGVGEAIEGAVAAQRRGLAGEALGITQTDGQWTAVRNKRLG